MAMDKKFKERLHREIRLRIREMRDGCLECRKVRGLCFDHKKLAISMTLSPKKYIDPQHKQSEA